MVNLKINYYKPYNSNATKIHVDLMFVSKTLNNSLLGH